MSRLMQLTYAALVAFSFFPGQADAQCVASRDLNGVWRSNDGGTYYVRQIGNDVYWLGMSGDNGRTWTNVFHGTRNGNTLSGAWADVPKGRVGGGGTLTLAIHGGNGVTGFTRSAVTGGFGGSRWFQPCNDVSLNPVDR